MRDLSLHILDIAQNSVKAGATLITILLEHDGERLTVSVTDNGCGMSPELAAAVLDPFTTTRTTRKVGLGLPLLRQSAEQTGGSVSIESTVGAGTAVTAVFRTGHIDMLPLGDLPATVQTLVQGSPRIDFHYRRSRGEIISELDTRLVREQLGEVPLSEPAVLQWIYESLIESEEEIL